MNKNTERKKYSFNMNKKMIQMKKKHDKKYKNSRIIRIKYEYK